MEAVEVGAPAPDVRFLQTDGRGVSVRELGGGQPVVLFFLRHYG